MESLIVDGVIDEYMLFLVHGQEVSAMTVLYYLAVWNLDLFEDFKCVVYDCEDFEH